MKKVLLSAFACDPTKGSEPGNGWNWAIGLAQKGYEVHCFTRELGKTNIQSSTRPDNLYFHYIKLPVGLESLYSLSQSSMYLYYLAWQWITYLKANSLHKKIGFNIAHHVTWGSLQMGSFLYKLNIPFVFGPAGGGQVAPVAFKKYFLNHWDSEIKRDRVSKILTKWNPACKRMVKSSHVVLASNNDTLQLAKNLGSANAQLVFDVGLPSSFFPDEIPLRDNTSNALRLLWVGRFLPRKGLTLVLEVMSKLKTYPHIELTVVGDGEMRKPFLEAIEHFQLQDNIKWVGKVDFDEVKQYYASHDIFLFSSLRDSGGVQLIEAMGYGLPVITLDLHGSGMIVDSTRGIKVSAENPDKTVSAIADAILSLDKDRKTLNLLSQEAFIFAKKHNWNEIIDDITTRFYN